MRPRLYAGRGFDSADHQRDAERVAVISYRYWRDRLGGGEVLGTTIELELQPTMILSGTQGNEVRPARSAMRTQPAPLLRQD